jgi:two-component system chemotaxis response regulator CheY
MAKILIVEDSSYMRMTLRNHLTDGGHQIVGEVGDGNQVLKIVQECKPEVVFLDIILPGLIGLDIIKLIKSKFPEIKIIIISVLEDLSIQHEALQSGASAYLCKPFSEQGLAKAMNAL